MCGKKFEVKVSVGFRLFDSWRNAECRGISCPSCTTSFGSLSNELERVTNSLERLELPPAHMQFILEQKASAARYCLERKADAETIGAIPNRAVQQEYLKYLTAHSEAETAKAKAKEAQTNAALKRLFFNFNFFFGIYLFISFLLDDKKFTKRRPQDPGTLTKEIFDWLFRESWIHSQTSFVTRLGMKSRKMFVIVFERCCCTIMHVFP